MQKTITLDRKGWWRLKYYLDRIHPDDMCDYVSGEHIERWKEVIKKEFKATYTEHKNSTSKYFYGHLNFDKPEFITWYNIKMSEIDMSDYDYED